MPATVFASRERPVLLDNDIHDPLRYDDDLLGMLAGKGDLYGFKRQNGLFDRTLVCVAGDCQIRALLAVDLHRQRDFVLGDEAKVAPVDGMAGTIETWTFEDQAASDVGGGDRTRAIRDQIAERVLRLASELSAAMS